MVVKRSNENKLIGAFMLMVIVVFVSCNFNKSVHKDLETGAFSKGDGIGCDDVLITVNGELDKRNQFVYGEKINLVFNNVIGLKKIDSLTYPALSMYIVKNGKDTLLAKPNLLEKLKNGVNLSPLQLRTTFKAVLPHENNEKYKVHVNIWDNKGDGTFTYELPFTVKKNEVLKVKSSGLKYSKSYLYNETLKEVVASKNIKSNHTFVLVLENVEGMSQKEGRVFPVFSINMKDSNGEKIITNENVLKRYEEKGLLVNDLKGGRLTTKLTFTKGVFNNPYKLSAKLSDKNSSKQIEISGDLILN